MKEEVPSIPPMILLILCVGVFSAVQPMLISEEKEIIQYAFEILEEQGTVFDQPAAYSWSRTTLVFIAPISALIWLSAGVLILSAYFRVTGNSPDIRRSWPEWIGFTLWSRLPLALYYLLFAYATLITGEISPKQYLAPLAWIPDLQDNTVALHLTIGTLWTMWIQSVGLHRWSERPYPICLMIVLVPWLSQWIIAASVLSAFIVI